MEAPPSLPPTSPQPSLPPQGPPCPCSGLDNAPRMFLCNSVAPAGLLFLRLVLKGVAYRRVARRVHTSRPRRSLAVAEATPIPGTGHGMPKLNAQEAKVLRLGGVRPDKTPSFSLPGRCGSARDVPGRLRHFHTRPRRAAGWSRVPPLLPPQLWTYRYAAGDTSEEFALPAASTPADPPLPSFPRLTHIPAHTLAAPVVGPQSTTWRPWPADRQPINGMLSCACGIRCAACSCKHLYSIAIHG